MCAGWRLGGVRDFHAGRLRYGARPASWLRSPGHEDLSGACDVAQKVGRGLQIPIRRVDVDVAQIGRQCDHVLSDPGSAWRAGAQCPHGKGMTEVVQARAMAAWPRPEARFPQQRLERAMNRWIGQRSTMTADEHMVIVGTEFAAAYQVAPQPRDRGVVQWHQAGFSELGLPNQQAIIRDVGKSQPQRLGNPQPGGGQQRDQSGVRLGSDRATRTESTGGFEEAADLAG